MKPYPGYKQSGIEWIGGIPQHWEITRLKFISTMVADYGLNIGSEAYVDEGVRFLRTTDIDDSGRLSPEGVYLPESVVDQAYLLKEGDFLISRSGTIGRAYVHGNSQIPHSFAGYLVRFRFHYRTAARFMFYLTKSNTFSGWLRSQTIESTIGNVNGQKYANMAVCLPESAELSRIVSFLDGATLKIDTLIDKKQRLIELLKEQRTAIINQAVTKGINPSVKIKDSGFEWIGEIPEHWQVMKLKYCATMLNGYAFDSDGYLDDGIPIIRIGDVKPRIDLSGTKRVAHSLLDDLGNFRVFKGDILLALTGATIGKSAVYDSDDVALLNQRVGIMRPSNGMQNRYLKHLIDSEIFRKHIDYECFGGAQENIGKPEISNFAIGIPPESEQSKISSYLDDESCRVETSISQVEKHIQLLQEYRTALISEVVTGKIDVRGQVGIEPHSS